jgi:hypothetical protein
MPTQILRVNQISIQWTVAMGRFIRQQGDIRFPYLGEGGLMSLHGGRIIFRNGWKAFAVEESSTWLIEPTDCASTNEFLLNCLRKLLGS